MKSRRNILFSTTRQWNPGDEFILLGILNVLRSVEPDFNPVIYNRSPEIFRSKSRRSFAFAVDLERMRFRRLRPGTFDNSFKESLADSAFIDLAVFAGTPEWGSDRLKLMYDYIDRHSIPVVYLGIGAGLADFDLRSLGPVYQKVIDRALLITVRDNWMLKIFAKQNPILLSCPALLSAPASYEKRVGQVKKIGLIYACDKAAKYNRINPATYGFMVSYYQKLMDVYRGKCDFEFVMHYVDELPRFDIDFPGQPQYYSYDAKDYFDIYRRFDLVIGPRVHGIGVAASMGIPGIVLSHDVRADTCIGFGGEQIVPKKDLSEALALTGQCLAGAKDKSEGLIRLKSDVFGKYAQLLAPILRKGKP